MKFAAITLCVASERVFIVVYIKCDPGFCNDLFWRKVHLLEDLLQICKRIKCLQKVNVHLSSLMMKVPDHVYVLG
jgi:hypothetical protein